MMYSDYNILLPLFYYIVLENDKPNNQEAVESNIQRTSSSKSSYNKVYQLEQLQVYNQKNLHHPIHSGIDTTNLQHIHSTNSSVGNSSSYMPLAIYYTHIDICMFGCNNRSNHYY